jgi:hypothetical protein
VRVVLFLLLVLLAAGCGGRAVAVSDGGGGVFKDVQDSHLDRYWSCGSLRAALTRYSPTAMNAAGVQAAAARTCDGAATRIKIGMSQAAVRGSMGRPEAENSSRGNRCWFYSWPRNLALPDAGFARVCFKDSTVSLVQRQLAPLN